MTLTNEDRELLDMLRTATPESKNLMRITLIAAARLNGQTTLEIPKCSRAEYKRHIKALRQEQRTSLVPYVQQLAAKSIDLIREVCPIK